MFKGSCVALVTPMTQDGALDLEAFSQLINWHLEQGTQAIVVGGSTGEGATLTNDELETLLTLALSIVKKSQTPIPIIAGTGSNSTAQTIEKTQRAKQLGADGVLIVAPYYNKPTQEGLYLHYQKVAETVDVPIILYNVPSRTGCDLLPETASKLSYIPNIVGIKDATGDLSRLKIYQKEAKPGFALYTGDDPSAMTFMMMGGVGTISVVANIAPKKVQDLCTAIFNNDLIQANELDESLKSLYKNLFIESNPIPVKWALYTMNRIDKGIRLPLTFLSEAHHGTVKEALYRLDLL